MPYIDFHSAHKTYPIGYLFRVYTKLLNPNQQISPSEICAFYNPLHLHAQMQYHMIER